MALRIGNTAITSMYKGTSKIIKTYKGATLLFSSSLLPSEFQQVEYIESTGEQYIDTGVGGKPNISAKAKFMYTDLTTQSNGWVCACSDTSGVRRLMILGLSNDSYFRIGYGNLLQNSTTQATINTLYEVESIYSVGEQKVIVNGNEVIKTTNESDFTLPYNLTIFGFRIVANTIAQYGYLKLYYLKLYKDNVLTRDYIPCYRKSDNVIGLYDLVNGIFYVNAGSGTFSKGADV